MSILAQFLLRLSFGLAAGMAITSPRQVSSGYYRNHLLVTLGLATLAALVVSPWSRWGMWLAITAAVLSYVGSVVWLYEARRVGVVLLWLVSGSSLAAALFAQTAPPAVDSAATLPAASAQADGGVSLAGVLRPLSVMTSGLVLGTTMAAMLLGHWYLNSPGMELAPLRRLLVAMTAAVGLQMIVSLVGLAATWQLGSLAAPGWLMFLVLRWTFGLLGVLGLVWMAWRTLEIPNTQSATGILYVAVIGAFGGELTALALSRASAFPL